MREPSRGGRGSHAATAADYVSWAHADVRNDVIEIVIRAADLGFCRRRVATALEATRCELAVIEDHLDSRDPASGAALRVA